MNKFVIYPGNYSHFIKDGLLKRENWEEVPPCITHANSCAK